MGMTSVKKHYDNLLAPYYSWMCGGYNFKLKESRIFFKDHNIRPKRSGVAVDLGAGSGFQSIPLAELGFNVLALDTSPELLTELNQNAGDLPIVTVEDNLLNFFEHSPAKAEVIVCMGDTLTHLASQENVSELFSHVYQALEKEGLFILSFRDMTVELKGLDRFIPVRSDAKRIFTCFLEYERHHVRVHDILYEMSNDRWHMKKSYFHKLRISAKWTKEYLLKSGLEIEMYDVRNAMITIIARKL